MLVLLGVGFVLATSHYFPDDETHHQFQHIKLKRNRPLNFGKHLRKTGNEKIEEIFIVDSDVEYIPKELKHHFPNLKRLSLYNSVHTGEIYDFFEVEFENLESLKIIGNNNHKEKLKKIPKSALKGVPNLKQFVLRWYKIEHLTENMFEHNKKLEKIAIYENKIKIMPDGIFKGLENLQFIDFSRNKIQILPPFLFDTNKSLKRTIFYENKIADISAVTFRHLLKLEYVDLRKNYCVDSDFSSHGKNLQYQLKKGLFQCILNHKPINYNNNYSS